MIKTCRLLGLCLGLVFFMTGVTWASCMSPRYENPFDEAQDVYLARVEAVIPTTVGQLKNSTAAIKSGNNISYAAFGMGTFSSHGVERTHIQAVEDTARLTAAYILNN